MHRTSFFSTPRGMAGRAADWLGLAAAPVFALIALVMALTGGSGTTCVGVGAPFVIGGMAPMYLLMSAVHFAPWLRRLSRHDD